MALDPNDPLIPLPWQMDSIRAYRASKAMQAEEDALKMEKLRMDISKAREEETMSTPIGRAGRAADVAAFLEQEKQKETGIPIGEEMGARMVEKGGPSILEATKMQGQLDVEARARQARVDAAKNYLAGEKSLLPTASIDMGGVKQTVLASEVGTAGADVYGRIYRTQVPQVAATYEAEGQSRDNAIKMASADVRSRLTGAASSGKIPLIAANGNPLFITVPQAIQLLDSDITPQFMKNQLKDALEGKVEPQAASWIKTRLGR
ncbi:MAG: hypothetical protein EBT07_10795 [Actinobacteria bacterium]|nr:hypothetical protein [Actinomycetota bacterium]